MKIAPQIANKALLILLIPIALTGCLTFASTSVQVDDACGITTPVTPFPELEFEPITEVLDSPVYVTHAGDGSDRLFIVEQEGRVLIYQNGALLDEPFLEIEDEIRTGNERGLLSIAFHPNYTENGLFYVYYTQAGNGASVIAEYHRSADPNRADVASERRVLVVEQPFGNHNGGLINFGPDGYLYIGLGDGGSGGDPLENGQDRGTLLGSLLRIDVEERGTNDYGIPADNPFVDVTDARPEIYAYGLRNPWRYSFDRCDERLLLGDVGQSDIEEINLIESGGNYGWNTMEGSECYDPPDGCNPAGLELPIAEYSHMGGHCSVTGGYVYRGTEFPGLIGHYLYGDYCTGQLWSAYPNEEGDWVSQELTRTSFQISSFGEDENGELYLVDLGGALYRITQ